MKVMIQGKHLRLTKGLKRYAAEHIVAPLERFYDHPAAELRIELGDTNGTKGGQDKECHLTLHVPGGKTIQIEAVTQDPYASIDAASDRLVRAVKKLLERRREPGHHVEHPLATLLGSQ